MSAAFLTRSLAAWRRKVAYRKARLAQVRKAEHADGRVTTAEAAHINKWKGLLEHAEAMVTRREQQIAKNAPLRERAWARMQRYIDMKVTEVGGNNHGVEVEKIIRANGGAPGEAWCGDTVAACYLKAGSKSVQRAWASVSWLQKLLMRLAKVQRGDVVTYVFDHTGLFDRWAPEKGPGFFYAGEGNTGNAGAASDSVTGGDGVKLKLRHKDQVAGFWRVRS